MPDQGDWRIMSAAQPPPPQPHDDNEDSMSVHERTHDGSMLIPARHLAHFRCAGRSACRCRQRALPQHMSGRLLGYVSICQVFEQAQGEN